MRTSYRYLATAAFALCVTGSLVAQEPQPAEPGRPAEQSPEARSNRRWRQFDEARDGAQQAQVNPDESADQGAPPPDDQRRYMGPPAQIVVPAGTFIVARVNQPISTDSNVVGDMFTATLAQPLIANGLVIARRGQTIAGRVSDVQKAGRVKGTSHLAVELTELTLVDGRQMPVTTQLVQYAGGTSNGRDATAIGATTAVGAAIGGAAAGGFGAGMGAIAGAGAATIGVLATRGRSTTIYPEAALTFRTLAAFTVSTDGAEHSFAPPRNEDYEQRQLQRRATVVQPRPYPYYWGSPYPYYWGAPYYGPSLGFYYFGGRGYYGGRGFYGGGRGFYGRGRR